MQDSYSIVNGTQTNFLDNHFDLLLILIIID